MRVLFFGYRDWAANILFRLKVIENLSVKEVDWTICGSFTTGKNNNILTSSSYDYIFDSERMNSDEVYTKVKQYDPDVLLFVGWSWIIDKRLLNEYDCCCLHVSPLPKYRGGSPIQHQIINGEKTSAVTLFRMTEKLDDGDILAQVPFSLDGHMKYILERIGAAGLKAIRTALDEMTSGEMIPKPQNEEEATFFKRRKPKESQMTLDQFENLENAYNFIRALEDPYPNAYLKDENGNKLVFKLVEFIKA